MTKPRLNVEQIDLLVGSLGKHRAWITGYEQGSGNKVPFYMDLVALENELKRYLGALKEKQ